ITGQTAGNWVVEEALADVRAKVHEGVPIAQPLIDNPIFPPMVSQMVKIGEETGELEKMLSKIADFYEDEVDSAIQSLTSTAEQRAATRACPRTPSPCEPNSSGSFRMAAAPMIGVASRKANRAASSFESPIRRPPPIVAPEREKPGISASACAAPTLNAPRQATRRATRTSGSPVSCTGARRRSSSAP